MVILKNALGTMFMSGYGIPADFVTAHMWFNISAANGKKLATQLAPQLVGKITFLVAPQKGWGAKTPAL